MFLEEPLKGASSGFKTRAKIWYRISECWKGEQIWWKGHVWFEKWKLLAFIIDCLQRRKEITTLEVKVEWKAKRQIEKSLWRKIGRTKGGGKDDDIDKKPWAKISQIKNNSRFVSWSGGLKGEKCENGQNQREENVPKEGDQIIFHFDYQTQWDSFKVH